MPPTGIPALERFIARLIIRRWAIANPPEESARLCRLQQGELIGLIDRAGPHATTRVQIKRLRGLEESSTNYSLAMVAEHLARVNRDLAKVLTDLARDRPSPLVVAIANYKPAPDAQPEAALRDLDASIADLERALADPRALREGRQTHVHPWFGPLSSRIWATFAPFHQALHLRQAHEIVKGLSAR